MTAPGPPALGRGVVIDRNGTVPPAWDGAPRVCIDDAVLAAPDATVDALHRHWVARRPIVVELAVDAGLLRQPEVCDDPPYGLDPSFDFPRERLQHLVWANTYDARAGEPVWWWGRKASRVGATEGGDADVVLADGTPAWIDGGPRGPIEVPAGRALVHAESVEIGRLTVARWSPPAADLAPDQLEAVAHAAGPARIIAPAGSGKTRVLTERLHHLLVDRGVETELVTAVAYNKRAAEEMVARTARVRPHVRTIHSLGLRILNGERRRDVLDERDVRRILEGLVTTTRRRANTDPFQPWLEALAEVRMTLRPPEVVEAERDDVDGLSEVFPRYRAELDRRGAVDFDEQVYGAVELLLRDPAARAAARRDCRHLLIDEFQDLTPAFLLLLRLLALPHLTVFGVGDDDQVIYGHAGADPGFLIDFDRLFPGAAMHPLQVNYRCPATVVDAARTLLSYNHRRVAKEIHAAPGAVADPAALVIRTHAADAGAIEAASVVQGWLGEGAEPAGIAVLTRVNSALLPLQVALTEAGVPVRSTLSREVLQRTGVRAALAYLRLGADTEAMAAADVAEVLRRPSRGFSRAVGNLLQRGGRWSLQRLADFPWQNARDGERMPELLADIEAVATAMRGGSTADALRVVRDEVGLGGAMGLLDSSHGAAEGSTHLDDLEALEQVASLHPDPHGFEPWLREVLARGGGDADGVNLSTVHRVKGMEWPRVIVAGVTGGLLPHRLSGDIEEERRVLHVAVTRASVAAVVLSDASRPSPFLAELTGEAPHRPAPPERPAGRARPESAPAPTKATPVDAEVGLAVELPGGYGGTIETVDDDGALVRVEGGATIRVRFGKPVSVGGRVGPLRRPDPPEVEKVFEALRQWRALRAKADGMPAYIVLNDEHLREIARRRPRNPAELRQCPGIGPTKLEKYGDDLLVALEEATA